MKNWRVLGTFFFFNTRGGKEPETACNIKKWDHKFMDIRNKRKEIRRPGNYEKTWADNRIIIV